MSIAPLMPAPPGVRHNGADDHRADVARTARARHGRHDRDRGRGPRDPGPAGAPMVPGRRARPRPTHPAVTPCTRPRRSPQSPRTPATTCLTTQVTLAGLTGDRGQAVQPARRWAGRRPGTGAGARRRSGTGKTTATRLLAAAPGLRLRRDRVDQPRTGCHPHAKPLSVVTDPTRPGTKSSSLPTTSDCDPPRAPAGWRGSWCCGAEYRTPRAGAARHAGGLLDLIEQSSSLAQARRPRSRHAVVARRRDGRRLGAGYDEIHEHLDDLERCLARTSPPCAARDRLSTPATSST